MKDVSDYSAVGCWVDCQLVRFRLGFPEELGGWVKFCPAIFIGTCRALTQWTALSRAYYIALGTHLKLYILYSGAYYDITPIRATRALTGGTAATWDSLTGAWSSYSMTWDDAATNPFTTGAMGTNLLLVADLAHGANAGDYVTFSGAVGFDGYTADQINQDLKIVSILDADNYVVAVPGGSTITPGTAGGGASVIAAYEIHVGSDLQTSGTGWGAGSWGRGSWGSGADIPVVISQLRLWSLATFGENLLANIRNAGIYYWVAADGLGTRAVELSTFSGAVAVPTIAAQIMVTPERYVMAFGCDEEGFEGTQDPLLVRWSDQENALNWEEKSTIDTAGSYRLTKGSQIIAAVYALQRVFIWTELALFSATYEGTPFVWGFQQISDSLSIISPNAAIEARQVVYWMSLENFFKYDGTVEPLHCTVRDYVFNNINLDQKYKVQASINSLFNEVQWDYPSAGSLENDRYVIYNFQEGWWSVGQITRTSRLDLSASGYPVATTKINNSDTDLNDTSGILMQHEFGYSADDLPLNAFIESSDFDIPQDGEDFAFIDRFIPDVVFRGNSTMPSVAYSIKTRDYPGQGLQTVVTKTVTPTSTQQNVRARGRQVALRIEGNDYGLGWRMGTLRLSLKADGKK